VSGQVVSFLTAHRGNSIPSPALLGHNGERFRKAVKTFAEDYDVPVIAFKKGDRKIAVVRPLIDAAERAGKPGVVAIGVAQEFHLAIKP
jgi:hypothetical protein